jgi:hypothetical protein
MSVQRKILLGFSLALLIAITIGCDVGLRLLPNRQFILLWTTGGFVLSGVVLLLCSMRADLAAAAPGRFLAHTVTSEHPLGFFKSSKYWGWILVLASFPMCFYSQKHTEPLVVLARTVTPAKPPQPVTPPAAPAAPAALPFPKLSVTGIICNGARSTAVINGMTTALGSKVEGVKVVVIERWGITAELEGRTRHFLLQP